MTLQFPRFLFARTETVNHPPVPPRSKIGVFGTARRANRDDLRSVLSPGPDSSQPALDHVTLALETNDGRGIEILERQALFFDRNLREQNLLVVGQIGSGKSQEIVDPVFYSDLADPQKSTVKLCSKDDDYDKTKLVLEARHVQKPVHVLNLADRWRTTAAWRLLLPDTPEELKTLLDDVYLFIDAHQAGYSQDYYFWKASAGRLITAAIARVRQLSAKAGAADAHYLLELPRQKLLSVLTSSTGVPFADSSAAFVQSGGSNAETATAFAQDYLAPFRDDDIAAVTSQDELRLEELFQNPGVLLVETPQRSLQRVRPLLNLFMAQLFRKAAAFAAKQPGNRLPQPLSIFLDDFTTTTGKLPEFDQHVNLLRSCGVQITAAVQSIAQVEDTYGKEGKSVLAGFSTKIFKSPVAPDDAEYASKLSGTTTVDVAERVHVPGQNGSTALPTASITVRPTGRALLLSEEVRLPPRHPDLGRASTVFLSGHYPFQAWFSPAYKHPVTAAALKAARTTRRADKLRTSELKWTPIAELSDNSVAEPPLSSSDVSHRLERGKQALSFATASEDERAAWRHIEQLYRSEPRVLLYLVEQLARRNATVSECVAACRKSHAKNIDVLLAFIDYWRLDRASQRSQ